MPVSEFYTTQHIFYPVEKNFTGCFNAQTNSTKHKSNVYENLNDYYVATQAKQGFIGKFANKIKNLFNFKSGTKEVEKVLVDYKESQNDLEKQSKAIEIVNKYAKSQHNALCVVRNFSASVATTGALALLKKCTNSKIKSKKLKIALDLTVGLASGIIAAIGVKACDAKTSKREYSKDEIKTDAVQGGIQGIISGAINTLFLTKGILQSTAKKVIKPVIRYVIQTSSIVLPGMFSFNLPMQLLKRTNPDYYQKTKDSFDNNIKNISASDAYKYYDPTLTE